MPTHSPSNSYVGISDLQKLYSIREILGATRKVISCPLPFHPHASNSPSFSIYTNQDGIEKFFCHGSCGKSGDVVDFIGYMTQGEAYDNTSKRCVSDARHALSTGYEICPPTVVPRTARRAELPGEIWKMFPLGSEVIEYADTKRGLNEDTLRAFGIGQVNGDLLAQAFELLGQEITWKSRSNRIGMTIPTFHFGSLMMVKIRWIDAQRKGRFINLPGSSPGLFGFNDIFSTTRPLAIVKGEIPKMVLWQRGITKTAAPTAGEGQIDESWGVWTKYSKNAIVIGDNDRDDVTEKLSDAYAKRCGVFGAKLYLPPPMWHDVDQWVLGDPTAMDVITNWMENYERHERSGPP